MNPSSSSSSKRKRDLSYDGTEQSNCKRRKNDVFINYSFQDIGNSYKIHLHEALTRNGFTVSDHTMTPVGHDMCFEVLKFIEDSDMYVVVFSYNYASSVRSLDELVDIMDRRGKKIVYPVFY
nr:TMV resistance protein N [Tanacetum cinerariifolium]